MSTLTTALRKCNETLKLIDHADCKDDAVWNAVIDAQAQAERALRDGEKQEPVGTVNHYSSGSVGVSGQAMLALPHGTKLYTHPAPSLQAVVGSRIIDAAKRLMTAVDNLEVTGGAGGYPELLLRRDELDIDLNSPQPAAAPSGDVERDAVAEAIFKVIKQSNMIDKDWKSGTILGFENGFRDQVNEAAKAAIAAITATKE